MTWEPCPNATDHRTIGQAEGVAKWRNSHHGGKGRYLYRAVTTADGRHVLERTANPDAEQRPPRRR